MEAKVFDAEWIQGVAGALFVMVALSLVVERAELAHSRPSHRRPKSKFVGCCPKVDIRRRIQGSI